LKKFHSRGRRINWGGKKVLFKGIRGEEDCRFYERGLLLLVPGGHSGKGKATYLKGKKKKYGARGEGSETGRQSPLSMKGRGKKRKYKKFPKEVEEVRAVVLESAQVGKEGRFKEGGSQAVIGECCLELEIKKPRPGGEKKDARGSTRLTEINKQVRKPWGKNLFQS